LDLLEAHPSCAREQGVADVVATLLQISYEKSDFPELRRLEWAPNASHEQTRG